MNKLTGRTGANLARKLMAEQPAIGGYLLGVDNDIFNEDERSQLFHLGMVIWQAMKEAGPLPEVDFETLRTAEAANVAMMEGAAESPDADERDVAADMLLNYPQPELLGAVVMAMAQPRQRGADEWAVREEAMGVMLIDLKT
ncbi:MAG: hypothetical protein FIA97_05180, partial [Methylococcaceae bacterium]|nr:hypothetical protein [Methylococcaceae bacterium]